MNDEGIRHLGGNRWQVRVKRIEARTGRQRNRKATVTGTKADARRARDSLRSELRSLTPTPRKIRLSEYAASWLAQRVGRQLKASTLRRYGYSLEHIVPALGDLYVSAITPADIRAYVADRIKAGAGGLLGPERAPLSANDGQGQRERRLRRD